MKTKLLFLSLTLSGLAFQGCSSDEVVPDPSQGVVEEVSLPVSRSFTPDADELAALDISNNSAYVFNSVLSNSTTENYCISPLSLSMALTMTVNTSDEAQQQLMLKTFGYDDLATLNSLSTKLISYINRPREKSAVYCVNSVWLDSDVVVTDSFRKKMAEVFGAPVTSLDFNKADAAAIINAWISRNTHGKITEMLDDCTASLYLINTLYFKSSWEGLFDEDDTDRQDFHGRTKTSQIDMMHGNAMGYVSVTGDYSYACISFDDPEYVFELIMGDAEVTPGLMERISDDKESSKRIILSLPRFSVRTKCGLRPVFEAIGFPTETGVSQTLGGRSLELDGQQEALIEVNEKGVEAAAATIVEGVGAPSEPETVEFTVDRPFTYIVRDRATGAILVMGAVRDL